MTYDDLITINKFKFNGHYWFNVPIIIAESSLSIENPTADDMKAVADWFHTTVDNLEITVVQEPIHKFINQIENMKQSYGTFPKDVKRTKKVISDIKSSNKLYPIYVEKNDPHFFIMEGRHRIVAFMILGIKTIPVAYVSKKT